MPRIATLAAVAATSAVVAAAALVATDAPADAAKARPAAHRHPSAAAIRSARAARLMSFDTCAGLLDRIRDRATGLVGPYGLSGYGYAYGARLAGDVVEGTPLPMAPNPAATPALAASGSATPTAADPQQGTDFSGTNVQEEGVDEPDVVKTDGRWLFTTARDGAVTAVDVRGGGAAVAGRLPLDGTWGAQLFLSGKRLLVIGGGTMDPQGTTGAAPSPGVLVAPGGPAVDVPVMGEPAAVVTMVDVSDPKNMRVIESMRVKGTVVGARMTGRTVRLVVGSQPALLPMTSPTEPGLAAEIASTARNREVVASAPLQTWLPTYRISRGGATSAERPLVSCGSVRQPPTFSGLGMLTVATIDVARGVKPVDTDSVQTDAQIVYGSDRSLYVATTRWFDPSVQASGKLPGGITTEIHRFDTTSAEDTVYRGSGRVTGTLLSQWAMSEKDGVLRVASTREPEWWNGATGDDSESYVTTLALQDAGLVPLARVGGLGRGERIRAVRFIGDAGYVVTFRQTDPLYVVDLSDPGRPRVRGELKIPGYSAYLHPVGDGLLLGVGQDATDTGRVKGTQISLFDVSDPSSPRRLQHETFPGAWSDVEGDHRAFLYWPATGLAVVPMQGPVEASGRWVSRALAFRVDRASGITRLGAVAHRTDEMSPILRSSVIGPSLYTVSQGGVKASRMADLGDRAWAPLG